MVFLTTVFFSSIQANVVMLLISELAMHVGVDVLHPSIEVICCRFILIQKLVWVSKGRIQEQ